MLCPDTPIRAQFFRVAAWFSTSCRYIVSKRVIFALLLGACVGAFAQGQVSTTTSLALTSGSGSVSTVSAGTVVTFTASVTSGSGAIQIGQVNFCDASAPSCTDVHLLGTAQLTSAGTATLKLRPGIGSHSYKAVFLGTSTAAASSSSTATLTVTGTQGPWASTTAIAETGGWGAYNLTATVTESGGTPAPIGSVSFVDTSNANAVLSTQPLGPATAGIDWPNPLGLTMNVDSQAVAVGDFNGDGIPDIATVAGGPSAPLVILLGNANGTFTAATQTAFSAYTFGPMVVADFNGDGKQDLAILDGDNNTVTILLGNGDGTFTVAPSSPATAANSKHLVVADFNGDGIPDLAVSNLSSNSLNIFLGNGDGTFTPVASSPAAASSSPSAIVAGDFNGDGKADLAVSDVYSDTISILLGNGDGTFAPATSVHSGSNGAAIVAADFNGDGKLDLAVGVAGVSGSPDSVTILRGNGDGTFSSPQTTQGTSSTAITAIATGDFNSDGIPDVAVANSSSGTFTIFLGSAGGTFTAFSQSPPASIYPSFEIAAGDMNGDGRTDLVLGNGSITTVSVFVTEPTETATATASIALPASGQHLVDASYSGDSNYNASTSGTLSLWGVPPATTTALTVTSAGSPVTSVTPGTAVTLTATVTAGATPVTSGQVDFCDATATYCTDIHLLGTAQLSSNGVATFKFIPGAGQHSYKAVFVEDGFGASSTSNTAALNVGPAPAPVYTDTASIASNGQVGDYQLTGTVEGFGGTAVPTGTVSFVDTSFGNTVLGTASLGSGTSGLGFRVSQTAAMAQSPVSEVTGDFNGDGKTDIALLWNNTASSSGTYSVTILFGNGDGTFTAGPTTAATGVQSSPRQMVAADLNGDGKTDLAILSWNFTSSSSQVTAMLGNGDGTFATPQTSLANSQISVGGNFITGRIVAADFNGDGKIDVAILGDSVSPNGVTVLLGNGDGTFTAVPSNYVSNQGFNLIATGDFNGDGIPDLVAINYTSPGSAIVLLGKGDGTFTPGATLTIGTFPNSIAVGDFNGDGKIDLAFGENYAIDVYLGKGDGTFAQAPGSPLSGAGNSLVAGDFNHDGKVDLAGISDAGANGGYVDLFLGAGDGTFTETTTIPQFNQLHPNTLLGMVSGDFDGNGTTDFTVLSGALDNALILLTEPTETATATVNGIAPIGAGTHNVEMDYPGDSNYAAASSGTIPLTAGLAPLTITPATGTYSTVQSVTITESIPGSTIYYQESGTVNTNGYVPYTGPIPLNYGGHESILAYATETGYVDSSTAGRAYTLPFPQEAAPTFSPAPGYYAGAQSVTLTDSDTSAKIFYTTNAQDPNLASTQYNGPITVASSETIAARAISAGYSFSPLISGQYVIGSSSVPMIYSISGTGMAGYTGDGGPATLAQTGYASSIVEDSSGNIYFGDDSNHMVRKIAAGTGIISVVAGNGYNGYSGDGGSATSAELGYPDSLALDSAGNLYIADNGSFTIRKVNLSTGIISTYAGDPSATSPGDGGPATSAELGFVEGLAVDASNNLYISSETLATIRVVNAATGVISTIAGTGYQGYGGDGGPAIDAQFRSPQGLAFDASGDLYIADFQNSLVRKITATNGVIGTSSIITTVAGVDPTQNGFPSTGYTGDGGPATAAELNRPQGVAVDSAGNLFITDYYNGVVREVTASNGYISTFAGNGVQCGNLSGDAGPATSASFCYPGSIMVDSSGNVLVGDASYRIREIVATGTPPSQPAATPTFSVPTGNYANPQMVTIADTTPGASIYVTVDGSTPTTGSSPGYSLPVPVAGTVTLKAIAAAPGYLASPVATATYNISASAPLITTVAGNGTTNFNAAGGPALNLGLDSPMGLAIDSAGNLYVSDPQLSVVWKISASTGTASIYAGTGVQGYSGDGGPAIDATLHYPDGLAIDSSGNLYIADFSNSVIREVAAKTGIISTVAGQGPGPYGSLGDGGPATSAYLDGPIAVAFDKSGNLYIADSYNYRIRKVSAATGIITTVAGDGSYAQSGDGGPATSAGLQAPTGLAVDSAGNIFLGTFNGPRIREVVAATGIIQTIAGYKDIPGDTGDGGPATSAEVSVRSLAFDAAGNLYISSAGEVRKINMSTGVISRVAGIGYPGFSGDGGVAAVAQIYYPNQVAFDAAGNLYLADGSGRIRKVALAVQTADTPAFNPVAGTYAAAQSVSITDATPGATIYYTTDGSTPSNTSNLYAGPITVASSETIKAVAFAAGLQASAVASAAYVINGAAAPSSLTSLSPAYTSAAGSQFTLTVNGSNFTSGSTVYWGSTALTTTLVSSTKVTATVPATDIASPGIVSITVQTQGASTSNTLQFEIDTAGSVTPPSFSPTSVTVTAGGTATSSVTLPSSATGVSAKCLNLPAGASCSYSSSTGKLTITTSASTPKGTYTVTVIFTETLPGAALAFLFFPFLLAPFRRERLKKQKLIRLLAITLAIAALGFAGGCGGGGGGGGSSSQPPPQTHQVTSSGTITVIVK